MAVGKLRTKKGAGDESGSAFRCGILLGTGLVFAIQGLISATDKLLNHKDPVVRTNTSYLLQLYGGYFLMLYLFLLFCLDCRQWAIDKVNYTFIFELDPRNNLDWRQLSEFPCFFTFLFGMVFWLNFSGYGGSVMFLWYPTLLIVISTAIIFLPLPILGYKSRSWFVYSHWRLMLAGLYPVEFRDFFLGDIYCSLTYALCNIELIFCLHGNDWENPVMCNSSHSRLMGFLGALPPIWRALQCIRRYHDTRNKFPHLVNCGKYFMTIMSAVTLSLYRINRTDSNLSLFIAFSAVNAVYASFWDLFMDFSLMQVHSKNPFLRDILAFKSKWMYWSIVVVDPILRFSWIFYAIFTRDVQHSALVSVLVALAEATRRGAWALFRVENEHTANVAQYKASRDVPLPYHIEPLVSGVVDGEGSSSAVSVAEDSARTSAVDVESVAGVQDGGAHTGARRRRRGASSATVRGLGHILAEAHRQDFEKRRKPEGPDADRKAGDDDDDDDEDEDEDELSDYSDGHGSPPSNVDPGMSGANDHRTIKAK